MRGFFSSVFQGVEVSKAGALVILAFSLGACSEHLTRTDAIGLNAGDAVAANRAIQTIDPWPRHAANATISVSAARLTKVIETYENPQEASGSATPALIPGVPTKPTGP